MHLISGDAFSSLWSLMYYFTENVQGGVEMSAVDFLNLNVIPITLLISRLVRMRVFHNCFLLNIEGANEFCKLRILFRNMHIRNAGKRKF